MDPNAEARRAAAALLTKFKALLNSEPAREEILQRFLRDHPILLCPGNRQMWPKLGLGKKETDFVFRDAVSEYLLVEIERSTHRLFREDGHVGEPLNVAMGQITDWKRYIEDNLRYVQTELGLVDISSNPKSLVVIGRSNSLSEENRRKLVTLQNERPKLTIWTYDDVYANAKQIFENLLGPIWETGGDTRMYNLKDGSRLQLA